MQTSELPINETFHQSKRRVDLLAMYAKSAKLIADLCSV